MDYHRLWEQLKNLSPTISSDGVIYLEDLLDLMDELEFSMMLECGLAKFKN